MTPDFILKALSYGVIGLCAVMLLAAWRVLVREQARNGQPRKGIIQFTIIFMGFCVFLVLISTLLQIKQQDKRLDAVKFKLEEIDRLMCSKLFIEVNNVSERLGFRPGDTNGTRGLEYQINLINAALREAWKHTGESKEFLPCPRPY